MTGRSLRASAEGIQVIRRAIKRDDWKQDELKDELGLKTRQPITRLLRGEAIERPTFEELCHLLGLEVSDVADETEQPEPPTAIDIDLLVQEARSRIQSYTQERCGMMRVLDMPQPIDLDNIYIQVNILQKMTRLRSTELAELLREGLLENIDRFCIGDIQQKRVPGVEAVEKFSKLMILGKPGAGKTTFLKHLAMQCMGGKFQSDRVPFFITLKEFAEAEGRPGVLEYCDRLLLGGLGRSPLAPLQKGGTGIGSGSEVPLWVCKIVCVKGQK